MKKLDRIFNRNNVGRRFFVAMIEHRSKCCRLAASGRANHQNQATAKHYQLFHLFRHAELVERRQFGGDVTQHH